MPYITREDGEHFVIPSYRDVLTAKQKSQLKREILALSQNYGEFITLQRKGAAQYEVAFSPDTGYLLGESIWHYFKRPADMIYCEAIPNTTEAILVIVKSGSVYLDGSFHIDSIPEELVIFLTQENNFEIYIHGDVPISEVPVAGKFTFEKNSVKTFTNLDKPVFPTLPLLKIYQLQLVDQVLKAHGIGVFPIKAVIAICAIVGLAWMGYSYISQYNPEIIQFREAPPPVNPYQAYNSKLMTPAPDELINQLLKGINVISTLPGWAVTKLQFAESGLNADVVSLGATSKDLYKWAQQNNYTVDIGRAGFRVGNNLSLRKRPAPKKIYPLQRVLAELIDRMGAVYPGNNINLGQVAKRANTNFRSQQLIIKIERTTPLVIGIIGQQFRDLPIVLGDVSLSVTEGGTLFSGSIKIEIVGK